MICNNCKSNCIDVDCQITCGSDTITLTGLIAEQTGTHKLVYYWLGKPQIITFDAIAGQVFVIPNELSDNSVIKFEIVNPDDTYGDLK